MTCASCETGLDHCHGTLVWHGDGAAECTDHGCAGLDSMRHALVIDCEAVDGGCGCTEPVYAGELLWAS
ncbi:hypothetical protein [Qaidamihabitans albus]|uniref:hypothetical protein n=1 Tax=Qaidamihabitans albus TaxID=2795733 RepID=UPI0018F1D28D|nr:hypothetical protein [Qaidamihabitans albus]